MRFLPYSPHFCTPSFTIARGPMDLVGFLIYGTENLTEEVETHGISPLVAQEVRGKEETLYGIIQMGRKKKRSFTFLTNYPFCSICSFMKTDT